MASALKGRLRDNLEKLAQRRETMSYRALVQCTEVPGPQVIRRLTQALEDIIRDDLAAGIEESVACLAVSQAQPPIPRAGFFVLLRELGLYDGPDEGAKAATFHQHLTQKVFERYS
jgi:hypothetical protein